jgi:pimeloyl-ACP methyl ester carboxylesterase
MTQSMSGIRKTVQVNHLGGIDASIHISDPFDTKKTTLILINSFTTCADLYESQFNNKNLTDKLNLLAIEPLGHGNTILKANSSDTFTYWDSAIMNLQVMEQLNIEKAFVLGTSQGAWMATRMALLSPAKVRDPNSLENADTSR